LKNINYKKKKIIFSIIFIFIFATGFSLYPQSLFKAIYSFDISENKKYIYSNSEKFIMVCHPVDEEFFSWMLNTEGSSEQNDFSRNLFEEKFSEKDRIFPVFSVNIKNKCDDDIEIDLNDIRIDGVSAEIYEYNDYALFDEVTDKMILEKDEEVKLYIYRDDIFVDEKNKLENLKVNVENVLFTFDNNPTWNYLKSDIIKYPRY
jgi:hypothetical protein